MCSSRRNEPPTLNYVRSGRELRSNGLAGRSPRWGYPTAWRSSGRHSQRGHICIIDAEEPRARPRGQRCQFAVRLAPQLRLLSDLVEEVLLPQVAADTRSVIHHPRRASSLVGWGALLACLGLVGCNASSSAGSSEDYPLVEPTQPERQPPITTANGAVVSLPALPTVYTTDPSPTCERVVATFHDGSQPARRPVVIPPAPGLQAAAITKRTTRLEWSFRDLPADCRPVAVLVSVRNGSDASATPTTKQVGVDDAKGSTEITYPDFFPPPDVAIASAYSRQGRSSRTVSVLIRRPANLP